MRKIRFIGWRPGMNKIKFVRLLNEDVGFTLQEAKIIKDNIVDGQVIEISVLAEQYDQIISDVSKCGIIVEMN